MKINIVIGNPPYNNDMYIPFVLLGHKIANKCTSMITPAKWYAKTGKDNDNFRNELVSYMNKIVYYPDCTDIFEISVPDGITYYTIKKTSCEIKEIKNMAKFNYTLAPTEVFDMAIKALEQEPKTGHWILIDECSNNVVIMCLPLF